MKPGHLHVATAALHSNRRFALLACPAIARRATADEVAPCSRLWRGRLAQPVKQLPSSFAKATEDKSGVRMCKCYKEYASRFDWLFVLNSLFEEFGERENAIKQPKFSVWGFPGTPRLCSKSVDFSLFKWRKNKSPTIFLWIKTHRSSCPRPFYLNTFILIQP